MKRGKGTLLSFAIVGMELSWRYAWATFLTTSILHQSFPFPEAIAIFVLAAAITHFSKGKGWRIVYSVGIQIVGFLLAASRTVYLFNARSSSFLSQTWLIEFFNTPRSPLEWFNPILVLCLTLMFWLGGITLARRSTAYSTLCSRFDLGIAAFTLLFLTKFLVLYKGGIKIEDSISQLLFFPFFIFSLLGIGLVRRQTTSPKEFLPGYRGIGVILSFGVVVVLFGTALVLFFLPYLTLAAEGGYSILKTAAKPLGPVLVSILRFIFARGTIRPEPSSGSTKGGAEELMSPAESGSWMEVFEKILGWVFGGILGFTVLVVSCVALFFLFRWLLSRTPMTQRRHGTWYSILLWIEELRAFLLARWKWMVRRAKGYKSAVQLYTALRIWGRHSGLPPLVSETPLEYGLRLKHRFPSLTGEIELIIEAFHREVYAETALAEKQLSQIRFAIRRMQSPRHWPSRLKGWFLGPQPLFSERRELRRYDIIAPSGSL
jgi:hypothetical protein